MNIKIISDGKNHRVFNKDTGENVENVRVATVQLKVGELSCAVLEVEDIEIDITADETFDMWLKQFKYKAHINGLEFNKTSAMFYIEYWERGLTPKEAVAKCLNATN